MAKNKKTKEAPKETPYERQKKLASVARQVLDANSISCFIGDLNDQSFYLVVQNQDADTAKQLLADKDIKTEKEMRPMMNDTALHLLDTLPTEEIEDNENE